MKRLLLVIPMLMLLGATKAPTAGYAGDDYWFCKSVGHTEDTKIVALSEIFVSDSEYSELEAAFYDAVHDQIAGYEELIPSRCMDYESRGLAEKHRKRQEHMARDSGYTVEEIDFP